MTQYVKFYIVKETGPRTLIDLPDKKETIGTSILTPVSNIAKCVETEVNKLVKETTDSQGITFSGPALLNANTNLQNINTPDFRKPFGFVTFHENYTPWFTKYNYYFEPINVTEY